MPSISKTRENIADIIGKARYAEERSEITHHGKPCAYIGPIGDKKILDRIDKLVESKKVSSPEEFIELFESWLNEK